MTWLLANIFVGGAANLIMIGVTSATFIKAFRGTRYSTIMVVDGLLIGANVAFFLERLACYEANKMETHD